MVELESKAGPVVVGIIMMTLLLGSNDSLAMNTCSTTAEAETVIATAVPRSDLVMAVAGAVPSDPSNCVPSFCAASEDQDDDTRAAIGAGISEAYSLLKSEAKDDMARLIRVATCSSRCDRFVVTSFAASQGFPVSRMCDVKADGSLDLPAPWELSSGGSGGVRAVSGN